MLAGAAMCLCPSPRRLEFNEKQIVGMEIKLENVVLVLFLFSFFLKIVVTVLSGVRLKKANTLSLPNTYL